VSSVLETAGDEDVELDKVVIEEGGGTGIKVVLLKGGELDDLTCFSLFLLAIQINSRCTCRRRRARQRR
jgi:hypothetical protein